MPEDMYSLHKIPQFHLIRWCGDFVERHRRIWPKLCGNCAFSQNFCTRKLGEISVFYAVIPSSYGKFTYLKVPEVPGLGPAFPSCFVSANEVRLQLHWNYSDGGCGGLRGSVGPAGSRIPE